MAACTSEPLSVGQPPCEAGEPRCETPAPVLSAWPAMQEEVSGQSQVEWKRLLVPSECPPENCRVERLKIVVHDTGEVTLAAVVTRLESDATVTRLWLAWFDPDGQSLWESEALNLFEERGYEMQSECSPMFFPCAVVSSFDLRETPDGRAIALVGSDLNPFGEGAPRGRLDGYAIERAGRVTREIMIDPLDGPPRFSALALDDVIIAGVDTAPLVFMRYSARGELRWRRSDAVAPLPDELKIVSSEPVTYLHQIATDSLGRVWALLVADGIFGLLRLDPTGRPARRAWVLKSSGVPVLTGGFRSGGSEWVFDSRQRPVIATSALGLLRLEPEAEGLAQDWPSLSVPIQEEFYSPSDVFGLDTDAQDRIYLATHEGPRSAPRARIDRISSDFHTRERYVLDLGEVDSLETLLGLQVTPGGDVYVLIAAAEVGPDGLWVRDGTGDEQRRIQLARLQLSAPGAPSAGADAR